VFQVLPAIVEVQLAIQVAFHRHAPGSRRSITLLCHLVINVFVAHDPVIGQRSLLFQAEDRFEVAAFSASMKIDLLSRIDGKLLIQLIYETFMKQLVCRIKVAYLFQPQLLNKTVLISAVASFHPALGLW